MMVRLSRIELSLARFRGYLFSALTNIGRRTGEQAFELVERRTDADGSLVENELTNGSLVGSAAFLQDGESLTNCPCALEVTEEKDGIGQIADVDD